MKYFKLLTSSHIFRLQKEVALYRNQAAFKELFLFFYQPMVKFSRSITSSEESAKEIYADIMVKIWSSGASLDSISNLKSYLYRAVKNESLNLLAQERRVKKVDLDKVSIHLLPISNTEDELLFKELNNCLNSSIKALPPKCQMVFKLIREDRLSYKEVAEILEISVNTVEGHMSTALAKLKKSLEIFLKPSQN